jgi:hypothetical protein
MKTFLRLMVMEGAFTSIDSQDNTYVLSKLPVELKQNFPAFLINPLNYENLFSKEICI